MKMQAPRERAYISYRIDKTTVRQCQTCH